MAFLFKVAERAALELGLVIHFKVVNDLQDGEQNILGLDQPTLKTTIKSADQQHLHRTIEFSAPAETNIRIKEEKRNNYKDLRCGHFALYTRAIRFQL